MNLKEIFLSILSLLFGLYTISEGIMFYKKKIIIQHLSEKEKLYFYLFTINLIQISFINNNKIEPKLIVMGGIPIIFLIGYVIYSRVNDVKYGIYNIGKEDYREIIKNTLVENSIKFSLSGDFIRINETPIYIEFIDKGILIKKCRRLPNYKQILLNLETNLKEAQYEKKTRAWLTNTLLGTFLVIIAIVYIIISR